MQPALARTDVGVQARPRARSISLTLIIMTVFFWRAIYKSGTTRRRQIQQPRFRSGGASYVSTYRRRATYGPRLGFVPFVCCRVRIIVSSFEDSDVLISSTRARRALISSSLAPDDRTERREFADFFV